MRIALIRGSLQRNWELPVYEFGGQHQVDLFVTRGLDLGEHSPSFGIRRLRSPAELISRLPPRARGLTQMTVGESEHLLGLERALDGYDIAHALELSMPVTLQAVRARDAGRCRRVVATVSENIAFWTAPNPVAARRAREIAAGVDRFVAITERARLHLRTAGVPDERISVLPFGIDLGRFSPAAERRPGPVRVISVARLETGKGVEDLVVAVGLLAERGIEIELTLAGDGPLRPRLQHIAAEMGVADRLHLRSVPWVEMPELYRDADIFVLASAPTRNWREQFGFAVVEAMATGLPALVGDSGSLSEVVGDAEALVTPHDPIKLADRLAVLAQDPERRAQMGGRARERALSAFDLATNRERLLELYEEVLDAPPLVD